MSKYRELLKSYCDRLVDNQITELFDPKFHGGILCPACAMIHGRIADAVYPLTAMYDYTGDEKYLRCARAAVAWSEHNLRRANGAYYNDKMKDWTGISVFSAIAFGEALLYHGDCLDGETLDEWRGIFLRLIEFIRARFTESDFHTNINYFFAYPAALAIAYRLTENEEYKADAYAMLSKVVKNHINPDSFIHGEYSPAGGAVTLKGSYGVDIGYNVEESIPALTAFAYYMRDEEYMKLCEGLWRTHIELMLPDGGWDNSFGTRHNKWTYYGSRTSDGCQSGLCYIFERDPIFAEAAERNFDLMYKCSEDGYLYGGAMYREADEEPCIHHSFTHAKAIAALIDHGFEHRERSPLPRECEYGLKEYKSINASLVSIGDIRATVSAYDCVKFHGAATSGGSLTMLYHKDYGPIFASSVAEYGITENLNMQLSRTYDKCLCTTPRIQRDRYMSVNATDCHMESTREDGVIEITASGVLKNTDFESDAPYSLKYRFTKDDFSVTALAKADGDLVLPVICGADGVASVCGNTAEVRCERGVVRLTADSKIYIDQSNPKIFNLVGGFIAANIKIRLTANIPSTVTVKVSGV